MSRSKQVLLILMVTGIARVVIIAVPVVAIWLGMGTDKQEEVRNE